MKKIFFLLFPIFSIAQNFEKDSLLLEKMKLPYVSEMKDISSQQKKLFTYLKTADETSKISIQKKIDSMENRGNRSFENYINANLDFLKLRPNYQNAIKNLNFLITKQQAKDLYAKFEEVFNGLDSNLKTSKEGVSFQKKYQNLMNSQPGKIAPQFILKDIDSKIFNLNENRGKIILIDFWASWCEPCLKDLPMLRQEFEKYKNKGFEIVSISRDDNLESWKKSIQKNKTENFIQISTKENDFDIENLYVITGIPVKFLIDKNGVIIQKWRGGSEEISKEIQTELEKIFKP